MAGTRQEFDVKVNIHDPQRRERYEGREFWSFVREKPRNSNIPDRSDSTLENILLTTFPIALKHQLVQYFNFSLTGSYRPEPSSADSPDGLTSQRIALSKVYFRARNISYGSLQFSVDVAGFENLVNLFDNNFDLFFMAFSSFIPTAFSTSLSDYEIDKGSLNFDIDIPSDFKEEFGQPRKKQDDNSSRQSESTRESLGRARLQWAWVASNTSLLVPVALALLVTYFLYKNLTFERTQAEARMQKIFDAQLSLLDKERNRADSFKEIEQILIKKALESMDQKTSKK